MKSSPLRLNWVTYPEASYDTNELDQPDMLAPVAADVTASVKYNTKGPHYAFLRIESRKDDVTSPYKFCISAVASFGFDVAIAKREYRVAAVQGLIPVIAVNISRVVYAGVREYLAMITSRATYGAVMLDSTLLEPTDVVIDQDVSPTALIAAILEATEAEVAAFQAQIDAREGETGETKAVTLSKAKENSKRKIEAARERAVEK